MLEELKQHKKFWNLFARSEEYDPILLDQYDRFHYSYAKHEDILNPFVSEYLMHNDYVIQYPEGKKFAVCLTHDVDNIYANSIQTLYRVGKLLRKAKIEEALVRARLLGGRRNKKWSLFPGIQEIIDLERKYTAKSSFYFMAIDKNDDEFGEFNYNLMPFRDELKAIVKQGWEIGLHGSRKAYNNLSEMKKEKERLELILNESVVGYRNHGLHFKMPNTWDYLAEAGFKYDSTLGYVDMVGFRNGMCHPYYPYNMNTNETMSVLEIPLIVMDGTLFNNLQLDINAAWKITKILIDVVRENKGVITINWHNTSFDNEFRVKWVELYKMILEYCFKENAWMTSGEEIWRYYKDTKFGK
jgi:hypothetical protein